MRCFYSFFQDHNWEWSDAERETRWHEAEVKSAARRARKTGRRNALIPFSGAEVGVNVDGKSSMEARFRSFKRHRGQTNDAPLWSLGMVVVWVMWRDFGRVTEMQNDPFTTDTKLCLRCSSDTLLGVRLTEDSTEKAFKQISVAVQRGQLSFTGIGTAFEPVPIDSSKWAYIAKPGDTYTQVKWTAGGEAYHDLYTSRDAVLALWPAMRPWRAPLPDIAPPGGSPRPQKKASVFEAIVIAKKQNPELRRSDFEKMFPNLSVRQFATQWEKAKERLPSLAKAGRPKNPNT